MNNHILQCIKIEEYFQELYTSTANATSNNKGRISIYYTVR